MTKPWFVLHTLTGQENKVQKSIGARIKLERMEEFVGRCVIPTERVSEKKNGRTIKKIRKFFPGYVLCELALYDESRGPDENGRKAIYERTWQFLRETLQMNDGEIAAFADEAKDEYGYIQRDMLKKNLETRLTQLGTPH